MEKKQFNPPETECDLEGGCFMKEQCRGQKQCLCYVGSPLHVFKERKPDKTGTLDKPDLIRDALQEFPFAQYAIADMVSTHSQKHPSRSWRDRDYVGGTYEAHLAYFTGKAGRHIALTEIDGQVNKAEGNQLHMVAAAWALLGYVDTMLRELSEANDDMDPSELLKAINNGDIEP